MAKVKRYTRKQLHRSRQAEIEERKAAERAARLEEKDRARTGRFYDQAMEGLRDASSQEDARR